jgi:hypothetical protein
MTMHDVVSSDSLVAVSFGAGVDSTAALVGMWSKGIRPDAILFADTGDELEETYAHVWNMSAWLVEHGMPSVTVVRRKQTKKAPYASLYENSWQNETMPSLAFGWHKCSPKWKVAPQDAYLKAWAPTKAALDAGKQVIRVIGFDAGDRDSKRAARSRRTFAKPKADKRWTYWYPLQEWGWDRAACIEVIRAAGAPVPIKSACFMCPARTRSEIADLAVNHPEHFARAVALENRARDGKHGFKSVKGLGRRFAWGDCPTDPEGAAAWAAPKPRARRKRATTQIALPFAA